MPSKFNSVDNKTLARTYEKVVQLATCIEDKCAIEQMPPHELPHSVLPTNVLFDIATCFESMYHKLLEYELLVAGYPKSTNTIH